MSNPFFTLQNNHAARLAARDSLADIPMITEELGDVINRLEKSLGKGGNSAGPARPAIADPPAIEFASSGAELAAYPGATILNGHSYSYRVSWKTAQGETAASEVATYNSANEPDQALRVPLGAAPTRATHTRIWRNIADGGAQFRLLAEVAASVLEYQDHETHNQFSLRADADEVMPVANTTATTPKIGCALLIHTPTGVGQDGTRSLSKMQIKSRVEIYFDMLKNDGPTGLQKVPLQVVWDVIQQTCSWNLGPGQPPVELLAFDTLENAGSKVTYYADFAFPVAARLSLT